MSIEQKAIERNSRNRPSGLYSWVGSVGAHLALLVVALVMLMSLPDKPRPGDERSAEIGIALKHVDAQGKPRYESRSQSSSAFDTQSDADDTTLRSAPTLESITDEQPSLDTEQALPAVDSVIGQGSIAGSSSGGHESGDAAEGLGGVGGSGNSGQATVRFCGVEGKGFRFIFVIDRSLSMGDSGEPALRVAKSELMAAIEALDEIHQFQIVFFNETPSVFNAAGAGRLTWADDQNKEIAKRFVMGIAADGGTERLPALLKAIALRGDVIYFLTDSGEPPMSTAELAQIRRLAPSSINAIEFGRGPAPAGDNFLKRIARENNGQYNYVDVSM